MEAEAKPLENQTPPPAAQPSLFDPPPSTAAESPAGVPNFRLLLRPTDYLPQSGQCYARIKRRAADPLGMAGLPQERAALDDLVVQLCQRLWSSGTVYLGGKRLAEELGLHGDTRALRELVAYAHVHHRIRAIVGVPGTGYVWGANDPGAYDIMSAQALQMGRCYFYLSTLYGKGTPAVEAAQLVFNFVESSGVDTANPDPLGLMMRAEGVTMTDVLSAIIGKLSETPEGRHSLQVIGDRHKSVLVSEAALSQAELSLQSAMASLAALRTAGRQAG